MDNHNVNRVTVKNSLSKNIFQLVKFCFVGGLNTLIALGLYYLLVFCGLHYIVANTLGYFVSIFCAYILNSRFVFQKKVRNAAPLVKTFISYGFTFLLSTFLLYLQVDLIGISDKIAPLIGLCITVPVNFLLNKFWTFR